MSFVADFHAKIFPMRASGPGSPELVLGSGAKLFEPFAWFDRDTQSWRTWQRCLDGEWELFSGIWPRSGMMRNGIAYRLDTLARPTSEIVSGLLPTPRKSRGYTNPTLGKPRNDCVTTSILGEPVLGMRPEPEFVEWKMGFPIGWTELGSSETL